MFSIRLTDNTGRDHVLSPNRGDSLMDVALRRGVPGIVAECGGALTCSTCHVYVADEWVGRLTPPTAMEDELLDEVASPRLASSRLACQIKLGDEQDGLAATIAPVQL